MAFRPELCAIPTVYCGDKEKKYPYYDEEHNYLYERQGSPYQCMKKGFGAGYYKEKNKNLRDDSLQTIKYVGPVFEENFRTEGILSKKQLIEYARRNSARQIDEMLKRVFRNSNGTHNGRGCNSTLMYLYRNGNSRLPQCVDLRERR